MISTSTLGIILIPMMFLLLFCGIPVIFGIGLAVIIGASLWQQLPIIMVFQQFYQGVDTYAYLAIPLFMLAGELMMRIGIVDDILAFCDILIGKLRGGLGYVNILANVFFAAISGSAVADMAAIGTLLVPKMEEQGYSKEYALSLTAAASVVGPIIPPSILMVIYAAVMSTSTGAMFIGGVVPGVLLGVSLMVLVALKAKKENLPSSPVQYTPRKALRVTARSLPALLTPVLILGGIFSGRFTPTEAACMACVYAILLGLLYYRNLKLSVTMECLGKAMVTAGAILLIIAVSKPFSWLITMSQVPQLMANGIGGIAGNKYVLLLIINVICLILGCLMDATPNCLIFAPIFAPMAISMGVDPLHFGVIFCLNLIMGVATPPFGVCLFLGSTMGKVPVEKIMKSILPFIWAEIAVLLLCTYIPDIVLFLPRLLGMY